MCLQRTGRWADALRHSLAKVYEPTTRTPVPWLLTGEAAMSLQGVDLEPDIIEFRATSPYAVAYFSVFMKPHEAPVSGATVIYKRGGSIVPSENWRSNVHQRIVAWSNGDEACWLGRWNIDGFPVEVSYTHSSQGGPLAMLPREDIRRVHFEGMDVAVAPLEYLLADRTAHGDTATTNRILHALRNSGYSIDLLNRALDALPSDKALRLLRLLEIRLVAG